jgi:hypothetical protein
MVARAVEPWEAGPPPERFADEAETGTESHPPPHDLDAEAAVLSAVMIDGAALEKVEFLLPEHFYAERHRQIFAACLALKLRGVRADTVTVANWLKEHQRIEQVGGTAYLVEVLNATPAVAHVAEHAAIIVDRWQERRLLALFDRASGELRLGRTNVARIADDLRREMKALAPKSGLALLDGPALAVPLPELDYLVKDIALVAGSGAPHLVAGLGFGGKTICTQDMVLCLAAGRPVWGAYAAHQRRIVYVDMEQGERLTRRRFQRQARARGIELASLGDALTVAIFPDLTLRLEHADQWRKLMFGRDLLVIDSLRAASPGADENDSAIRTGLDMLGRLSEDTACRALVIHHARKPSAEEPAGGRHSIRGSSAIFDAVDSAYIFSAESGEPVQVDHVKARSHGEPVPKFALVIADVEIDGDPRAGLRVQVHGAELVAQRREAREQAAATARASRDALKVERAVIQTPGLATRELRGATGLSGDRLAAAIAHLGTAIEVREERDGRARPMRHYSRRTP